MYILRPESNWQTPDDVYPHIQSSLDWWLSLHDDGVRTPQFQTFDPVSCPILLSRILIVSIERPSSFRYHYVGNREIILRGNDPTGMDVENAYFGSEADEALQHYRNTAFSGNPVLNTTPVQDKAGRLVTDQSLFLPFWTGDSVSHIIVSK